MLTITGLALALAIAAFLIYVALKSNEFRITRSQSIKVTPETAFALINDLHAFNRWNPFTQGDPALRIDYSDPPSGPGAAYAWESSGKTGKGRMQITQSKSPSRIVMQLVFLKPMTATNTVEFALALSGSGTTVTWSMSGLRSFTHKLMGTIFNMDKMVGGEFEKGLATLKTMAEK